MTQADSAIPNASRAAPLVPMLVTAVAIAIFTLMDALMKGVTEDIGAYNAMLWRSLLGFGASGLVFFALRRPWPGRPALALHAARAGVGSLMAWLFFDGIAQVPLAQGTALTYIAPIIALFLARIFLHEKINSRVVLAAGLGFCGVLIVAAARLHTSPTPAAAWAIAELLLSAVLYAGNIVLMRSQAQAAGPVEIVFFQSLLVTLIYSVGAPRWAVLPTPDQFGQLGLAALCFLASIGLLAWAYARAQAQFLVPVEYTSYIWAVLLGAWMFGDTITIATTAGAALIVAACWSATRAKSSA